VKTIEEFVHNAFELIEGDPKRSLVLVRNLLAQSGHVRHDTVLAAHPLLAQFFERGSGSPGWHDIVDGCYLSFEGPQ
jgi:hypothetical protein